MHAPVRPLRVRRELAPAEGRDVKVRIVHELEDAEGDVLQPAHPRGEERDGARGDVFEV
jgi:hypothetical protein